MTRDTEQFRAGFEAHAAKQEWLLTKRNDGSYYNELAQAGWESWVAAKREASTEPSVPQKQIDALIEKHTGINRRQFPHEYEELRALADALVTAAACALTDEAGPKGAAQTPAGSAETRMDAKFEVLAGGGSKSLTDEAKDAAAATMDHDQLGKLGKHYENMK